MIIIISLVNIHHLNIDTSLKKKKDICDENCWGLFS